jgi:hypothetical protein
MGQSERDSRGPLAGIGGERPAGGSGTPARASHPINNLDDDNLF